MKGVDGDAAAARCYGKGNLLDTSANTSTTTAANPAGIEAGNAQASLACKLDLKLPAPHHTPRYPLPGRSAPRRSRYRS
jgi:hypothetical protein